MRTEGPPGPAGGPGVAADRPGEIPGPRASEGAGILVLCLGSSLMGDDGVGLAALERLRREWELGAGVTLADGGTWGMNLLPEIESAGRLVLVDAVRTGRDPGTVVRLEGDRIPRFFATKISPHQVDLKEVLALAELRGTLPPTVVLGVEPARVELSTDLSPEAEASVPRLVRSVVEVLEAWGADVRPAGA